MELAAIRYRLATDADVPALRRLVNAAYGDLAAMGLNFTGTFQDEAETRERMIDQDVHLAFLEEELIGTVSLGVEEREDGPPVFYVSQLAVNPRLKRQGVGRALLKLAEQQAREKGLARLQLDTAVPATHLVALYQSEGYAIIDEVHWRGKTYRSYIMEKKL